MVVYEIPLTAQPQTLSVSLSGAIYQITVMWRASDLTQMPASSTAETDGSWVLDIADATGNPLLRGLPLVTGADLLAQYAYIGIPGSLVVQTDHDPDAVPTWGTLGSEGHLYFVAQ